MRGPAAGVSFSWLKACANELRMRSLMTSACTFSPNCLRTTVRGALPTRKPFRRAVRANLLEPLLDLGGDLGSRNSHLQTSFEPAGGGQ